MLVTHVWRLIVDEKWLPNCFAGKNTVSIDETMVHQSKIPKEQQKLVLRYCQPTDLISSRLIAA